MGKIITGINLQTLNVAKYVFYSVNVKQKISDIPRLSVGFGSMNQVPSRLRIISRSEAESCQDTQSFYQLCNTEL